MGTPTYANREAIKLLLETADTAYNDSEIDDALQAATDDVHSLLRRKFYPEIKTLYFPWPSPNISSGADAIWLGEFEEVISIASLVSGGVTIASTDYYLEPANQGPPYNRLELNRGTSASFSSQDTSQRAITLTGLIGYDNVTRPAGLLAEALDASETQADVTNSAAIGVGDLIVVESERMIVTEKDLVTTGQTLQTPVTASTSSQTIAVTDGTAYTRGELITLDAEQMRIVNIAGNNLIVKRQWGGSTLAAHTGSTVYAPRRLTVERAALGTTAATHADATAVSNQRWPSLVNQLCIAEALVTHMQATSAYARTIGDGENTREASGRGLNDIRRQAQRLYGRKMRHAAV